MSDESSPFNERVVRLERANRRMKTIGLALAAALATMGSVKTISKTIQAQAFQVVNASGAVVATLGATNGNGCLSLYDGNGALRESICTSADLVQTGFATFDQNGIVRTSEGTNEQNTGGFIDYDLTGSARAFVGNIQFNNQAIAITYDPSGTAEAGIAVNPGDGFAGFVTDILNTSDATYHNRVAMGTFDSVTTPDSEGFFVTDANDVPRAGMLADNPCCGGADTELMFFNNTANKTVGSFFSPSGGGGTYFTFDQNGNQTGSLPSP